MLSISKEDKILKLWQGLGYYSRARNLHFTAKYLVKYHNGIFPKKYDEILKLKGIGIYTAAAISSFAFQLPYAVLDGNVIRVISRVFGVQIPHDSYSGKKHYQTLAQQLLDKKNPAEYNQAIMDFGATQCTPKIPQCKSCSFAYTCAAYNTNMINKLPLRSKKNKLKIRFLNYLVIKKKGSIMLGKRKKGIWKGLYEFPCIELLHEIADNKEMINSDKWIGFFQNTIFKLKFVSDDFVHKLSHQKIHARFWIVEVLDFSLEGYFFIKNHEIVDFPVSRLIDKFLKGNQII